jgi:nucleoside-diphosphate-sugar epimerase
VYLRIDVLNKKRIDYIIRHFSFKQIYHLAALLSAKGEEDPSLTWDLNMQGLLNVLEASVHNRVEKVFWPSSIAVFGPRSARAACPQSSVTDPTTAYGISKVAGEFWCKYYFERYGLDVRSLRYPGLISHSAQPGGGTTDYAVEIFHQALRSGRYSCFLGPDTRLPMLYMPDAVQGTIGLMEAPADALSVRTSYNLDGMSFTPHELARSILDRLPGFEITYAPDGRQKIADSWPSSIDARHARTDWGWRPQYDLEAMTGDMLVKLTGLPDEKIKQMVAANKLTGTSLFKFKTTGTI